MVSLSFTRLWKTNYLTRQSVFDESALRFNYFYLKVTFDDKLNFIKENTFLRRASALLIYPSVKNLSDIYLL